MAVRVQAQLSQDELKKQAAWKAVDYVKSGMILGLGTGSTAAFAVDRIGDLLESGELKDIIGVPTSVRRGAHAVSALTRGALTRPRHWVAASTLHKPE
jgi:ribose 5-phosphate isomerase A